MPIYFLAFNDERQGGVESNDKVWLWNLDVTEWEKCGQSAKSNQYFTDIGRYFSSKKEIVQHSL